MMIAPILAATMAAGVNVESQSLELKLDIATHHALVVSTIDVDGAGSLRIRLNNQAQISSLTIDHQRVEPTQSHYEAPGMMLLDITVPENANTVRLMYTAEFEDDIEAGERPGEVHNFSVDAHIGDNGVFLSDGAVWHPQPIDGAGRAILHPISINIAPVEGWAFIATGDPIGGGPLDQPCASWNTPRPVDGMAVVGNQHVLSGVVHETRHGPVEIALHLSPDRANMAPMLLHGAAGYLDLYTDILGPFPYARFTVFENFFSSGFAYPGFTVISSQVFMRGGLVLRPGLLDHEMVHNWWGNGVYVDRTEGNWCEAVTAYCTNYYRRIADEGEAAGLEYRRATLMKLSTDPATLDNGPLCDFGSANPAGGGTDRFVGYDKGAYLFMMLEAMCVNEEGVIDRAPIWAGLRRFSRAQMGRRSTWNTLQTALETEFDRPLGAYFDRWVRTHTVPVTPSTLNDESMKAFEAHFAPDLKVEKLEGTDERGAWVEIDPEFRLYRVLPQTQIVPLIGGTFGPGGVNIIHQSDRPEAAGFATNYGGGQSGENLIIIGAKALATHADLLTRCDDPLTIGVGSFTIGDTTYDGDTQSIMHTMHHPDQPGRYITVFHSNGDIGWQKLRLIVHYRRDTTVVWDGADVIARRTYEPSRRIYAE